MKAQNSYLLLVGVEKKEDKTSGGIILPSIIEDKDTTASAEIHEAPEGSVYKKGQVILFSKYLPVQFTLENKSYMAVKEQDVIAVL